MKSKKVFVALPVYTGDITAQTVLSLLASAKRGRELGIDIDYDNIHVRIGDADISNARNAFLGRFLASDCTDLWFIDADVSWDTGQFERLFEHDEDFVAGVYRSKTEEEKYPILWSEKKSLKADPENKRILLAVDGVAGGFWRLSRDCVERVDAAAERHFYDKTALDVKCPWVFEFAFNEQGQRLSEDYVFCQKWKDLGGKVWIDPTITVEHTGKKTYTGDLIQHLKRITYETMMDEGKALMEKVA